LNGKFINTAQTTCAHVEKYAICKFKSKKYKIDYVRVMAFKFLGKKTKRNDDFVEKNKNPV